MPRTHGIQLSPSQHKTCFRSRYGSAPTSWSACTLLHSCQSSSAPNPPGSNQPSIREPRDCSRAPCCTSKFPGTVHPHLRGTCTPTPSPSCHHLLYQPRRMHTQQRTSPPSQPLPRTRFLLLIPHSSTHKSLASHATTKSCQVKANQIKSNLPGTTLPSPPSPLPPSPNHHII
jgi:hypothetical protein